MAIVSFLTAIQKTVGNLEKQGLPLRRDKLCVGGLPFRKVRRA
jgi:hypothetical protein